MVLNEDNFTIFAAKHYAKERKLQSMSFMTTVKLSIFEKII